MVSAKEAIQQRHGLTLTQIVHSGHRIANSSIGLVAKRRTSDRSFTPL